METQSLPTRFRLPLPKPVSNGSFSSFKFNEFPINTTSQSQTSSLDVIPCQQTLNLHPIGKPLPNRRGRKPLATMPLGKKHMQNLNNQRAFRQRKENYVRNLEMKASNLETLYNSAQEEIKNLKSRVDMLEKKLASSKSRNEAIKNANNPNSHYGGIVNSAIYQAIVDSNHTSIYDENKDGACDIMNGVNEIQLNDNPRTSSSSSAIYIRTSTDYPTTSNDISLPVTSVASQQIPKDSDLFCDPINTSDDRIWIASTSSTTTSPLYPTFVTSNPSQNARDNETSFSSPQTTESQWIQPYFSQAPTAVSTAAHHHPLNLKWILSDAPNEE